MEPEYSLPHFQMPATCLCPEPDQSSQRSILILSSYLCLGLLSGLFPSGFPSKSLYKTLLSPTCASFPPHPILLDLITRIIFGEEYRSLSSSCSFLHSPVTSSFLGWNNPQHPILNTLCLISSLNVGEQVSHLYTKQAKLYFCVS